MANRSYQRACAPVLLITASDAMLARVECGCGAALDWRLASRKPPPDIIRKHFIQRGWRLDRRATCPTCQEKKPMAAKSAPPPVPSDAARAAKQLVFLALIDFYDSSKKSFKPGHSDESIAKECGVSKEFVAKVREADFGPIMIPTELDAWANQFNDLHDLYVKLECQAKGLASDIENLRSELRDMVERNGWVV